MQFRKKPVVIEASQWFKNGDHPLDAATEMFDYPNGQRPQVIREGAVVRYYRHPDVPGDKPCEQCGKPHHIHGWIDTLEQGHRVCPGDWIITGVKGERYPCKPDIFAVTYDAAPPVAQTGDLLPCPFCGTTDAIEVEPWHGGGPDKHLVSCVNHDDCDVNPSVAGETRVLAIAAWNRRAASPIAALAAVLEQAEDAGLWFDAGILRLLDVVEKARACFPYGLDPLPTEDEDGIPVAPHDAFAALRDALKGVE